MTGSSKSTVDDQPTILSWPYDWPYDWQRAQETLQPKIIRQQGRYLLNRALNMRNTIGFLGTGVSNAYGRVSWAELAQLHTDKILEWWGDPDARQSHDADSRVAIAQMLQAMRGALRLASGDDAKRALQLGEQIWALSPMGPKLESSSPRDIENLAERLEIDRGEREALRKLHGQPEYGRQLFRLWIKRETADELAHVQRLAKPLASLFQKAN